MTNRKAVNILLIMLCTFVSRSVFAQACKHTNFVSLSTSGEIIEGPTGILGGSTCVVTSVNALQFTTKIMRTVSETAGKALPDQLQPPSPITVSNSDAAAAAQGTAKPLVDNIRTPSKTLPLVATDPQALIDQAFQDLPATVQAEEVVLAAQQKQVRDVKATLVQEISTLKDIVANSDHILAGGPQNLIGYAQHAVAKFGQWTWPDIETTISDSNFLKQRLEALKLMKGWSTWDTGDNKQRYDDTVQRLDTLIKSAAAIAVGTDIYTAASQQNAVVQQWVRIINALVPEMFTASSDPVHCSALFNVSRNNTLKVVQMDNLPTLDLKPPTPITTDNWVIVRCSNPFSVSAGTVFSFLGDNEFGIVASKVTPTPSTGPATVNQFQVTSSSNVPILPVAIAHGRLWDVTGTDKILALHVSFGVAGHIRSGAQGGSNPEYLLGGSLSVFRTLFITGGPYWGTRVKLDGGFSTGDTVPTGVTAPPLQKSGTRGWALAVTFTKP